MISRSRTCTLNPSGTTVAARGRPPLSCSMGSAKRSREKLLQGESEKFATRGDHNSKIDDSSRCLKLLNAIVTGSPRLSSPAALISPCSRRKLKTRRTRGREIRRSRWIAEYGEISPDWSIVIALFSSSDPLASIGQEFSAARYKPHRNIPRGIRNHRGQREPPLLIGHTNETDELGGA